VAAQVSSVVMSVVRANDMTDSLEDKEETVVVRVNVVRVNVVRVNVATESLVVVDVNDAMSEKNANDWNVRVKMAAAKDSSVRTSVVKNTVRDNKEVRILEDKNDVAMNVVVKRDDVKRDNVKRDDVMRDDVTVFRNKQCRCCTATQISGVAALAHKQDVV